MFWNPISKMGTAMSNESNLNTNVDIKESAPCVLLGVTGCIAAYKSCEIIRALQKAGVRVKVVMTEHATSFVGTTTFRALTGEPVGVGLFDEAEAPIHHISLAQECDIFLIAPATANVIAKIAAGIADDLLTTTALSISAPLIVAPAMNVQMYEAAATQENLATLALRGVKVVEPEEGYLACGEEGKGRLADIQHIVDVTLSTLQQSNSLDANDSKKFVCDTSLIREKDMAGINVLVTAGPTIEPIDPVRYISNYSSGKMGYAVASAAIERGANVTLISGPVSLNPPVGAKVISVKTADDMLEAVESCFAKSDVAIFAAAVVDMRPTNVSDHKLKKGIDDNALSSIELSENPDVLAAAAKKKRKGQCVVGFAAETDDIVANAWEKLADKNADIMIANKVGDNIGFFADDNKAWIVENSGVRELDNMTKTDLAHVILDVSKSHLE